MPGYGEARWTHRLCFPEGWGHNDTFVGQKSSDSKPPGPFLFIYMLRYIIGVSHSPPRQI
jgi:hypothetical protein